ncbi:MAG: hypothetical protein AABW86_04985 [Candidatus Micrarchaeota archaeon]
MATMTVPVPGMDTLLSSVMPYAVPTLIALLIMGIIYALLRNLKLIIGLAIVFALLASMGVIPQWTPNINLSSLPATVQGGQLQTTPTQTNQLSVNVEEVVIGVPSGNKIIETRTFDKNAPLIKAIVKYKNAVIFETMDIALKHLQSGKIIGIKNAVLLDKNSQFDVEFPEPKGGWEIGDYALIVAKDGKELYSGAITVV